MADGLLAEADITELGAVKNGAHQGRTPEDELTLFDGTGVGLQDLAVASEAVNLAIARGVVIEMYF